MSDERNILSAPRIFLMAILLCGSLGLFIAIASEVMSGNTTEIDKAITAWFRDPADLSMTIGPSWLAEYMRDATALGSNWLLAIIGTVVVCVLGLNQKKELALFVLGSILTGMLVSFALKMGFDRPRPDLVPHRTVVYTSSFPSGHAMMSSLFYFSLAAVVCQLQSSKLVKLVVLFTAMLFTFLVGASRVFLGVHWASDVVAGWSAGIFWSALCFYLIHFFSRKRSSAKVYG